MRLIASNRPPESPADYQLVSQKQTLYATHPTTKSLCVRKNTVALALGHTEVGPRNFSFDSC